MIDNKKREFVEEYPDINFPWYEKVEKTGESLLLKFDINLDSTDNILSNMENIAVMSEDQSSFSLNSFFNEHKINIPKYIYFFSLNYNEVVKFKFIDIDTYLMDFWEFDENIFLIDESFQWCLFLFDDNLIYRNIN